MGEDWPETRDELIDRFSHPEAFNGPTHDRAMLTEFVDLALSRPDPFYSYLGNEQPNITPSRLCHLIYDHCLLFNGSFTGWIDRQGRVWGCRYASHELLLELMGMNSIEQELEGWIKLSARKAMGRFAPNTAQMRAINRICDGLERVNGGDSADAWPGVTIDTTQLAGLPELKAPRRTATA